MTNTNRSQRPPQAKRRARRSSLGCSLAFVAVLVLLAGGVIALGPTLLDRLLGTPASGAPVTINDPTSPEKLAALHQQESTQLGGYGWVNQASGIARIPINRAIALVAEKGLPVGKPPAQAPAANATAATSAPTTTVDLANVSFTNDILPIFEQHCQKCHGSDNPEKGLELTSYSTLMTGAEDGSVVTPGDPDKSYLVEMVVTKKMPKKGAPLSTTEINTIVAWVKAGAKDDTGNAPKKTTTQATAAVTTTTAAAPVDLAHVSFKNNVLPIFQQHCQKCHGSDNPEKGLELTSYSTLMTGAEDGSVVTPGDPNKSYLVEMVVTKKMPKKAAPLSAAEINTIVAWIKAGATDDTDTASPAPAAQSTAPVSATEQSAQTTPTTTETQAATETPTATAAPTTTKSASPSAQETATNTATVAEGATTTPMATVTSEATAETATPSAVATTATVTPLATTETPTATTTLSTTATSTDTNASSTVSTTTATTPVDLANVSFQKNVLPIFKQHCLKCHGNDNPEKGLELTQYQAVMTGSEEGSVVEPGDPDNSYLVKMVVSKKMPKKGPPLSSTDIQTIVAWIKAGAKDN